MSTTIAVCIPQTSSTAQLATTKAAMDRIRKKYTGATFQVFSEHKRVNEIIEQFDGVSTLNPTGIAGCMTASSIAPKCMYVLLCDGKQCESIDTVNHICKTFKKRFYIIDRKGELAQVSHDNHERYKKIKSKAHLYSSSLLTNWTDDVGEKQVSQTECCQYQAINRLVHNIISPVKYFKDRGDEENANRALNHAIEQGEVDKTSTIHDIIFIQELPKCECNQCSSANDLMKEFS